MAYLPALRDATFVTLTNSGVLTSERTAAVGNNLKLTDGGANAAATFQAFAASTITGNTTLTATSNTSQFSDATSAAFAVTLPAASTTEKVYLIKKIDSSANAVTVTRAGSDTIEGATTYVLSAQYDWVIIQSDGTTAWKIIGRNFVQGSPASAQYLVLANDATLSAERVFTPGNNCFGTDAGANSTYTLQTYALSTISGNTTLTATSNTFQAVDATGGAVTVTLPAATNTSKLFSVKKVDSSANTVTIARAGSDTIDGATSYVLNVQYEAIDVIANGTASWYLF